MAAVVRSVRAQAQVQVIGLCRFSYVGLGGFKVAHDGLEERRAYLHDPVRLAGRMVWFEHVFLPPWRAQTDGDFTLVVLLSADFPEPFRARLHRLVADLPQIRLTFRPPMAHRDICRSVVAETIAPSAPVTAQFRLDDDDAVAVDYVASLRRDFADLAGFAGMEPLALDYGKGLVLTDTGSGVTATPRLAGAWTPALTVFLPRGHAKSVLDYPHHKLALQMPMVSSKRRVMFLRGVHSDNDTGGPPAGPGFALPANRVAGLLRQRFRVDLPALEKALSDRRSAC